MIIHCCAENALDYQRENESYLAFLQELKRAWDEREVFRRRIQQLEERYQTIPVAK